MSSTIINNITMSAEFAKSVVKVKILSLWFIFTVDAWTVAFSPDSRFLASGSHLGKINLFGVDSGKKDHSLETRGKLTFSIAYVSGI